jgi:hypothetical protein
MALRDWHGWQIGVMWGIGIALAWLVGRLGMVAVSRPARSSVDSLRADSLVGDSLVSDTVAAVAPQVTAGGAPLWTTGVVLLIVTILLIVTVRWVKGNILDQ